MRKIFFVLIGTYAIASGSYVFAHGDHEGPGALPPPPNGGRVEEAKHHVEHAEKEEAKEDELFYEAFYKDKQLKIFALLLSESDRTMFKPLSATEFSRVSVKVEFPRAKKFQDLTPTVSKEMIAAPFDPKGANRFIVHVSAFHNNELKEASIQLEKE